MTAPFQTAFQTYATDIGPGILDAAITGFTVLDPTENNEPTLLLEEDDPYAVQVDWQVTVRIRRRLTSNQNVSPALLSSSLI